MKNRNGFTLVELLVVIVILGIVTGISIPIIRNIQANNEKKEYLAYMDTIKYSTKLYVDSYEDDLFERHKSGCAIIKYKDLYEKGLIKDIPINNVSCATDSTFVKVVKLDGKYGYGVSLGCGYVKNNVVQLDTFISDVKKIEQESCDYDITMYFNAVPEPDQGNNYKKRNIKVNIISTTGINDNAVIYYGFSYERDTNVINNNWQKLNINIPGKQKQKEDIYSGKTIIIESNDLVTPVGVTGDIYLVLRIDKLENLSEEEWVPNDDDKNIKYFGKYRVDNIKPQFNDSTVISSENGFNSLKPKLDLKVTDNYSSDSDLSMCISYDSDTCSMNVNDMKNRTTVDNYTNNTKYEEYDSDKLLSAIKDTYDSSIHTIYVVVSDAAGNYEKKSFLYRIARRWTLTYDSNGGDECNPTTKSYTFNDWEKTLSWGELCEPVKGNYKFLGWSTNDGETITSSSPVNNNLTVLAQWENKIVKVTIFNTYTNKKVATKKVQVGYCFGSKEKFHDKIESYEYEDCSTSYGGGELSGQNACTVIQKFAGYCLKENQCGWSSKLGKLTGPRILNENGYVRANTSVTDENRCWIGEEDITIYSFTRRWG